MTEPQAPPKTLAWNGVSVQVPRDWAAAEFQACALRLEGRDGQELDLRWRRSREPFDPEAHWARLAAALGPGATLDRAPDTLPPGWAAASSPQGPGSVRLPFAWRGKEGGGLGALMHHPDTGLTANARFILPTGGPLPEKDAAAATALAVLESLGDHPPEGLVPWAAFGVTALVPGGLELRAFSFTPGHFRLTLAAPRTGCDLVLDRLGPTDALLGNRTLAQYADAFYGTLGAPAGFFAESPAPEADASPDAQPRPEPDMVQGAGRQGAPLLRRLLRRPWAGVRRGRMWRAGIGAVLLGAFMRGRREADMDAFEAICRDYALDRP
jgi:hypothetical protein